MYQHLKTFFGMYCNYFLNRLGANIKNKKKWIKIHLKFLSQ